MRPLLFALFATALFTGCALQPGAPWAVALAAAAAVWLWGCFQPPPYGVEPDSGATTPQADGGGDGGRDAGPPGTWGPCCSQAGTAPGLIYSCFCPENAVCNFGWFTSCGNGTCTHFGECPQLDAGVDGGQDAGGTWEPCCEWDGNSGTVGTCFCPDGLACNFGWFNSCPDGTCTPPGDVCPP